MSISWLSTPALRLVTLALLAYAAIMASIFLFNGVGSNGRIDAAGAFLLGLLGFTALLGTLGMRRETGPDARPKRRLLLTISSMMAAAVALLGLLGSGWDILTVSLPMFLLCAALHFVDRRYAATNTETR